MAINPGLQEIRIKKVCKKGGVCEASFFAGKESFLRR
jgi:hypothetical protein